MIWDYQVHPLTGRSVTLVRPFAWPRFRDIKTLTHTAL